MAKTPVESVDQTAMPAMADADFMRLSAFIESKLGIKMPIGKKTMIQSRLLRRLKILQIDNFRAYCDYLLTGKGIETELTTFMDLVTTNKTSFFRELDHFRFLARKALPALGERQDGRKKLTAWSAACSSGEEPYSLSIVLAEFVTRGETGLDFSVLGTDVSTRVLEKASAGVFGEGDLDPVPAGWREKYFLRSRDRSKRLVRVVPAIRSRVRFGRLNFMTDRYPIPDTMDVIFCRNVLIYFDKKTQEQVINKLCAHLAPGGFLFVGLAETLHGLSVPVKLVGKSIYRND